MNEPSQGFQPPPTDEQIADNEACNAMARYWNRQSEKWGHYTIWDANPDVGQPSQMEASLAAWALRA
jgi:hypothetical protein